MDDLGREQRQRLALQEAATAAGNFCDETRSAMVRANDQVHVAGWRAVALLRVLLREGLISGEGHRAAALDVAETEFEACAKWAAAIDAYGRSLDAYEKAITAARQYNANGSAA